MNFINKRKLENVLNYEANGFVLTQWTD